MRPWILSVCALVSIAGIASARMPSAGNASDTSWFLQRTQALYDAVAGGDKAIWRRTLAEDCIVTDEDGHVYDKAEFVDTLRGLPKGFSGVIRVQHLTARTFGPAASVHYWLDEHEDVLGQMLHTVYVETDTYRRQQGTWRMIAAQVTVVPADLKPVAVDERGWPQLVGSYRLGGESGPVYHAHLRHGALYWGRDEKSAKLLIPLSPLVFFVQGSIHTIVFVRDPAGHVTDALELHKYNEVVMHRRDL
jgi:Domain of unknown function (DUF4440)